MLKTIRNFALAIALVFGANGHVWATHTAIIGSSFTAVGDVSSSLSVNANRGAVVNIYINGVYDMVIALERERGSPGSGAFAVVPGFRDIAPAANTLYRVTHITERDNEVLRLRVTTDTSGTAFYSLFDGRTSPRTFTRATHLNSFWEFYETDTALAGDTTWQSEMVSDVYTSGTAPVQVTTNQEGTIVGTVGTGTNEDTDAVAVSTGETIAGFAALISDGVTSVTWRVRLNDIVGNSYGFGLSDAIPIANTIWLFEVNTNLVTDTGTTNDIVLHFSSDADATTSWNPVSTNGGTIGNNADEFACPETIAVDTYMNLTIQIEATGDAFFYVDDVLCAAEALATATTARLVPYAYGTSAEDDTSGGGVFTIDYVDFYMARPAD